MKLKLISLLLILSLALSLSGCFLQLSFPSEEPEVEEPEIPEEPVDTELRPSGPITPTEDGYTFETFVEDEVIAASDIIEASKIIDDAIMSHLSGVTLDLSAFGEDFTPADFDPQCEFASHIYFRYTFDANNPHILTVHINYIATAASKASIATPENAHYELPSANDILSRASVPENFRRGESFSAFPIDTDGRPTLDVYNSEELWWAVEHGYRPTFPIENSHAERIYEQAKDVLREIIYNGMSDFEKALAIYEYIVSKVTYDYDTYNNVDKIPSADNTCYYLEGVFGSGRAVCDGKSKAIVLLCGIEGIEAVREFGYQKNADSGHAWNYVKIDGIWYSVDTTNGDVAKHGEGSPIADFYGKNVELINYKLFLAPISTHADKYNYSGRWKEITDTDVGQSRVPDILVNRLCDAYIESSDELASMLSSLIELGFTEFSLTVSVSPLVSLIYGDNTPHTIANNAIDLLGLEGRLEKLVFKENIDSNNNYMYVFKLLPEISEGEQE